MRRSTVRTFTATAAALAALSLTGTTATATPAADGGRTLPSTYVVSTQAGTVPEGIHVTPGGTMYVSSYGDGWVRRGHVRDGVLHEFVPAGADGRTAALGVHADRRGRVFVVGGSILYVYELEPELRSGRVVHAIADGPVSADTPTTLAVHRCRLHVVNSQLDRTPGTPPYVVSAVADPTCGR